MSDYLSAPPPTFDFQFWKLISAGHNVAKIFIPFKPIITKFILKAPLASKKIKFEGGTRAEQMQTLVKIF